MEHEGSADGAEPEARSDSRLFRNLGLGVKLSVDTYTKRE